MVYKLVRIDAEEPNKIQLPLGTHLIGRGKFLDCEDKRISRNHGHLIITEDSVVIEALHQNPCFFTKKGSEEKQLIKKTSKEKLDNGDRFGLLPGSYWYEVLLCALDTDSQATDLSNTQELDTGADTKTSHYNDKTLSENDNCNVNGEGNKSNEKEDNDDSMLDFDLNEIVENFGRSESPSLLDQHENEPQPDSPHHSMDSSPKPLTDLTDSQETWPVGNQTAPNSPKPTEEPKSPKPTEEPKSPKLTEEPKSPMPTEEPKSPKPAEEPKSPKPAEEPKSPKPTEETKSPKRSHSMEADEGVKRIKTEPADVKEELSVKQEPDAGPSGGQADQAGASNDTGGKAPPSPTPQRERCIYGADCYRRNPVHKAQFAHPRDPDWGVGEQAPCPYGARCRKREPRHWRVHTHPPGTRPPDARPPPVPRPKAKKRQRRQSGSDDSEESGSESPDPETLVLNTKRARKPLPKLDSQDSENEDPFASDGSDEWVPPSDYTETPEF